MQIKGRIVKGIGGFYYVHAEDGLEYECRARGKFRLDEQTPVVGDWVEVEIDEVNITGYLLEILPRKNYFKRPLVSNVDQFVLVLSASTPKPDLLLCDKLLIQAEYAKVDAMIVLNKVDERTEAIVEQIREEYGSLSYALLSVSARTGEGLDTLSQMLLNKLSCFSGQSAVGKSSILNAICRSFDLETGGLARKTARGKHTTRASTLLTLDYGEGYVMDTPGFSLLDLHELLPEQIAHYYPEMQPYIQQCQFGTCLHITEPNCAVKEAYQQNKISKGRYERYEQLVEESQQRIKNQYR